MYLGPEMMSNYNYTGSSNFLTSFSKKKILDEISLTTY